MIIGIKTVPSMSLGVIKGRAIRKATTSHKSETVGI
jgi:hypothetical protein